MNPADRLKPPPTNQRIGLGDVVHIAAKPVVRVIRAVGGPDLATCGGCASRRAKLNAMMPDIKRPLSK